MRPQDEGMTPHFSPMPTTPHGATQQLRSDVRADSLDLMSIAESANRPIDQTLGATLGVSVLEEALQQTNQEGSRVNVLANAASVETEQAHRMEQDAGNAQFTYYGGNKSPDTPFSPLHVEKSTLPDNF